MPKYDLLKSHFGMGVLQKICCIFSEHLLLRTPLDGRLLLKTYQSRNSNLALEYFDITIIWESTTCSIA